MNAMRSVPLWVAAILVGGFAACNHTVGECWYYGEGSENAGAGPGGGVILPTGPSGAGGYGEAPPKQPQDDRDRPPPECNEGEDDATELGELVCDRGDWGLVCRGICQLTGVTCPAAYPHNVTKESGMLFKCCNCKGDQRCWYAYESGDFCVFRPATKAFTCGV
jgi:hypothetical protein